MEPAIFFAQQAATATNEVTATDGSAVKDQSGTVDVDPATILEKIDNMIDTSLQLLPNLVIAIIVFFLIFLIGGFIRKLLRKTFGDSERQNIGIVLGRLVRWASVLIGIIVATTIIVPSVGPGDLLASLGVGGVAIGFAFKDILQNLLAGILLLINQPFKVGDQVDYEGFEGTVERIETRCTIIKTYDGRQILIPNGQIYVNPITVNTAYPVRRSEYDVGIGYGDNMLEASEKMIEAMQSIEGVADSPAPEVLAVELGDSTVNLRARWWTDSKKTHVTHLQDKVIRTIKQAMDDNFIDMPFPTQIVLLHDQTEETDGDRTSQREGWPSGKNPPRPARIAAAAEKGEDSGS